MLNKMVFLLLFGVMTTWCAAQTPDPPASVESIHVVRSLRLSRDTASAFCAAERTGFEGAKTEDRYEFKVVVTSPTDGAILDASKTTIGELHACFAPTSDPATTNFYGQGRIAQVAFEGKGDCRQIRRNFPEQGIMLYRCYLELQGLPAEYVGGLLTTNTVTTRQTLGELSDPPGYTQPSIATVRLWKIRGR